MPGCAGVPAALAVPCSANPQVCGRSWGGWRGVLPRTHCDCVTFFPGRAWREGGRGGQSHRCGGNCTRGPSQCFPPAPGLSLSRRAVLTPLVRAWHWPWDEGGGPSPGGAGTDESVVTASQCEVGCKGVAQTVTGQGLRGPEEHRPAEPFKGGFRLWGSFPGTRLSLDSAWLTVVPKATVL